MVENVILDVSNFLKGKNILVPCQNQWLRGCITCFKEITEDYTSKELKEFVYEQWKLADLRDICAPSLPNNCKTAPKLLLPGKYAVQINSVVNIGESCYKQLEKIRRPTAADNLSVDTDKEKSFEISSSRTLKLEITDGLVSLLAFEDVQIKKLVEPFVPGIKAILNGPFECRKGVLFLKNENIDLIGGELDDLSITNSLENILARKLGQPENKEPLVTVSNENQVNDHLGDDLVAFFNIPEDDEDAFLQIPDQMDNNYSSASPLSTFTRSAETRDTNISHYNSNSFSHSRDSSSAVSAVSAITRSAPNSFTLSRGDDPSTRSTNIEPKTENVQAKYLNSSIIELGDSDDEEFALIALQTASLIEQSAKPPNKTPHTKQASLDSFFSSNESAKISKVSNTIPKSKSSSVPDKSKGGPSPSFERNKSSSASKISPFNGATNRNLSGEDLRAQLEESYTNCMGSGSRNSIETSSVVNGVRTESAPHQNQIEEDSWDGFIDDFDVDSDASVPKRSKRSEEELTFPPKRYPCTQIVRCCVKKLTQKLCIQENEWSLTARVKIDGLKMEVEFSPESLDDVFGMKPSDVKIRMRENPKLKGQINEILLASQKRILALDCDMKIHFTNYIAKPVVLEIYG